jgi:hypothetical protein
MKRPSKAVLWKAVRGFCLACVGGSVSEVERCSALNCQLHPFRFGNLNRIYKSGRKPPKTAFQSTRDSEGISRPENASSGEWTGKGTGKARNGGGKRIGRTKLGSKGQGLVSGGSTEPSGNEGDSGNRAGSRILHDKKNAKADPFTRLSGDGYDPQRKVCNA